MDYRPLGHSGINVSAMSLGSWNTFEFMPEPEALAVMTAAVEAGINFLDDARYDDTSGKAPLKSGYSEVVFGNLLRAGNFNRENLVISNRMWFEFFPEESFVQEVDGSLARIGIDNFDLVFCFTTPEALRPGDLVKGLAELIASGKISHWAPGNWPVGYLAECCAIARRDGLPLPPAAMVPYSLLNRSVAEDAELHALCSEYGIGLIPSFALQGGILTGKYNATQNPASVRQNADKIEALRSDGTLEKVACFTKLAESVGYSTTQLAFAFCLNHPHVSSVLFGATSVAQVNENVSAVGVQAELDHDLLERMRAIFP
jgi:L-glyceraldehyde 3-phosphate reductase